MTSARGIRDLLRAVVCLALCGLACAGVRTTACGGNPADVMFVLDSSNSIWEQDFIRQLTFVQEMIDIFPIAPNLTRVALITFDTRPQVIFYFNTFKSKSRLRRRIGMVRRVPHDHTFTDRALHIMTKVMRMEKFGARHTEPEVTQVAIVITDGQSDNTTLTAQAAARARDQGTHVFAIGVGDKVDEFELRSIASSPSEQYVHRVHSYAGLDSIKELLAIQTCTVTDPPTAAPPSTTPLTTQTTTTTPTTTPITTQTSTQTTTTPSTTAATTKIAQTTAPSSTTTTPTPTTTATSPTTVRASQSTSPIGGYLNRHVKKIGPPNKVSHRPSPTPPSPPLLIPDDEETEELWIGEPENEIDPNPSTTLPPPHPAPLLRRPFDPEGINRVCIFDEPTDIVFVIDEKHGGPEVMSNIWKYIKDLLQYVDMSNGNVNIKFIYECVDVPNVQLGSYNDKSELLAALSRLVRHPRTSADLLQHMSYRLLESDVNSIEPHHKIGVYITDGPSGNISATLNEAQTAKLVHNIELFGVGIGKDIDPTELRALVSCEVDTHLHMVLRPRHLQDVVRPVIKELCRVRRHQIQHPGFPN